MMFGTACKHMTSATTIYFLLQERMSTFPVMTKEQVAHLILWAIFIDARANFNMPHDIVGNLPVSSLDWLIGAMKWWSLPSALGTPMTLLFRSTDGASNPYQIENGSSGRQDKVPRYQRGLPPPNTNFNSRIEAATAAAQRCNPNLDYQLVMNTAPHPKPRVTTMMLTVL